MHILSKSTYIKGLQCPKALYMTKKHPYLRDKLSIEQRNKFKRGTDVGVLAHGCFPGGIDMTPGTPSQFPQRVQQTMDNLSKPEVKVMYEAVFQYNDTLIMLDMLVRDGDRWMAVEVKSSMRLSDTFYNDAALQYYVLHGCQVPLSDFRLMYLNSDYVKQGPLDVKQLFVMESVMEYVKERESFVAQNVERLKQVVAQEHAPLVNIGTQCHTPYTCDFIGHCWKHIPNNSFLFTNAIDDDELFRRYFSGVNTNEKMLRLTSPDSLEAQQIEALENGTYFIDFKTLYALRPQSKPQSTAFLNLLIDRPAVPELDGARPYEETILAFALSGEHESEGLTLWDCFDDHSRWRESVGQLIERLARYECIVCFTPQNLTTTLLRHAILQNREVGYKVFNLFDALQQARFYHPKVKPGFTLQHLAEAIPEAPKLFEHSRIIVEALSNDLLGHQHAKEDMIAENEAVAYIYHKFFK